MEYFVSPAFPISKALPVVVFAVSLVLLWASAWGGALLRRWPLADNQRRDFGIILGTTLTMLGIIIGFTFSMASSRYELRKSYEAAEANAIGTEYARAELLPRPNTARVRALLKTYLAERIAFYVAGTGSSGIENELWAAVREPAVRTQTPVTALVVGGMNDVLNSAAYTQAAWLNRIPATSWILLAVIAVCCNTLIGYSSSQARGQLSFFLILPFVVSLAFMLIADLDTPRGGLVHVVPENLMSLSETLPR
jgi:hypothetical protein